ncbi:MAG TPA: hypothetical protein VFG89_06350 [Coriobacteriia bacterium]|nr:hypothetical protein [Coriobacteriia bacterium]
MNEQRKGLPPLAEATGYIGAALVLAAIVTLIAMFWQQLGIAGHIGVGLAVAVAGLGGGLALERIETDSARRLSQFLLLAGTVGAGFAIGFGVRDPLFASLSASATLRVASETAAEWGWFAGAAGVAVAGAVFYLRHHTVLQHLIFGIGVAAAALLALPLVPTGGPDWGVGATLVLVGLAWGALSLAGRLEPRVEGLVLSALGIAGGIQIMAMVGDKLIEWPMWLGAIASAGLIWAGSRLEEMPVLGIGTVSLMVFAGELVGEYLGFGVGTGIALIAVGFMALGAGIRLIRTEPDAASRNRKIVSEVAGYLGVGLAMGGAGILFAQAWNELGVIGRILVPLAGALAGYAGAWIVEKSESGQARRLSQVLYFIAVLSSGIMAAMIARPFIQTVVAGVEASSTWAFIAGSAFAVLAGGVTWWLRKGSLTQIGFLASVIVLIISVGVQTRMGEAYPSWVLGMTMVAVGTLWVILGVRQLMTPARTAIAAGCYACLQGLQMSVAGGTDFQVWAAVVAIAFSIGEVILSIYTKRAILLGFGAVGTVLFSVATVMEVFGEHVAAPILLLAVGVVFIGAAVTVARLLPRFRQGPPATPGPVSPAL